MFDTESYRPVERLASLARSYRYLDAFADLPFVNVGNSKLVVKVISAGERDLGLLRFIEDRAVNHLPNCACERDDMWFHRILLGKQESSIRDTVFIAVAQN